MHNDNHIAEPESEVKPGSDLPFELGGILALDGEQHRVLAILGNRVLLASVATDRIYLEQSSDSAIGLPLRSRIAEMTAAGRVRCVPSPAAPDRAPSGLVAQIDMLDRAKVPNGAKAIAIFLHRNWTADMRERYGDHDDPATLKRWRTVARRPERRS